MPGGQEVQKKAPRWDIVPGGQVAQRLPLSYVPGRQRRVSVGGTQRRERAWRVVAEMEGSRIQNKRGRSTSVVVEQAFMLKLSDCGLFGAVMMAVSY